MKDVCVIGGGVVGLCCAYYLREAGIDVTVIDKTDLTEGCSHGNAGMIVPSHFIPLASPGIVSKGLQWMFQKKSPFYIRPRLDFALWRWLWLFDRSASQKHVEQSAPLLVDMHQESKDFYITLNRQDHFDFGLQSKGILMMCQTAEAEHEEDLTADMAYTLGVDVKKLSNTAIQQLEPGVTIDARCAFHYTSDAHFHPGKFMSQLIAHLKSSGVTFKALTEIVSIEDKDSQGCELTTSSGEKMRYGKGIITCGSWSGKLLRNNKIRIPMVDGKGYSMTIRDLPKSPSIPSILIEPRVALTPFGNELRISGTLEISGMDDKVNQNKVEGMLEAVSSFYPQLKPVHSGKIWYGYRPCSPDGLPYVGRWSDSSSLYIATGHAMMGMSLAPATGRIIRDTLFTGKIPAGIKKLSPNRFS